MSQKLIKAPEINVDDLQGRFRRKILFRGILEGTENRTSWNNCIGLLI